MIRPLTYTGLLALVLGCSSSQSGPSGSVSSAETVGDFKFSLNTTIPSGSEEFWCKFVQLPKAEKGLFMNGNSHHFTTGSHHILVYRTTVSSIPPEHGGTPWKCSESEVMDVARGFVAGGQAPDETSVYPDGVALPLDSEEVMLLQAHYLNTGAAPLDVTVDVRLGFTAPDTVKVHAGVLRYYDPFIYVPPMGKSRAQMTCTIPKDITLLGGSGHMHARAVDYQAYIDLPNQPPTAAPFYTTQDWAHPPKLIQTIPIAAGSSIRYGCDYQNTENREFLQGKSAKDNEMCMFVGLYYPAMDESAENCDGLAGLGSGTKSCTDMVSCIAACPRSGDPDLKTGETGACFQKCVVDSCPNASGPAFSELKCVTSKCKEECTTTTGGDCNSCALKNCNPEVKACFAASCAP